MNSIKAAQFLQTLQVHFLLHGQQNYVFKREFMYVKMFHKSSVIGTKENVQKAAGLRWILC